MSPEGWVLGQVGGKWFAMQRIGHGLEFYDPEGISNHTAKWNPRQKLSKKKAIEMVDRLNRKGPLVRVDGGGNPV